MQLPYNSPGGYLVHVLFSQCAYFPVNGPGRPSGKPRYDLSEFVKLACGFAMYLLRISQNFNVVLI